MPVKAISLLIVFNEIYWVGLLISTIIQRGIPTNPVVLIAIAIEIVLGFMTYGAYKQYLTSKSYKRWNFLLLALTVIGIGTPITLFYTIDFLKPAGGTWGIYVLTLNSFYFYRIIKKEPIQRQDIPSRRSVMMTISKVFHAFYFVTIVVMLVIVSLLPTFKYTPAFDSRDPYLILIEIVLALMSLLVVAIGVYLPRIVGWIWKFDKSDMFVLYAHVLRISFFESTAIFGLILGILGGAWYAWLTLFVMAGAAMVFTFPTQKRWEEWKTGRVPIQ